MSIYSGGVERGDLEPSREYMRKHPGNYVALVGVTADAPIPEQSERQYLADFSFSGDHFNAIAMIFHGASLRAAIVRSVMAGMRLLRKNPIPSTVTSDAQEAVDFLASSVAGLSIDQGLAALSASILQARAARA